MNNTNQWGPDRCNPAIIAEQTKALRAIGHAILESIAAAGSLGAPSGVLYSALMAHGCRLSQYQSIMAGLERAGLVSQSAHCYTLTGAGRKAIGAA